MKSRIIGKFTFQTAGVLFVLSALLELFSINSRVPLFGNIFIRRLQIMSTQKRIFHNQCGYQFLCKHLRKIPGRNWLPAAWDRQIPLESLQHLAVPTSLPTVRPCTRMENMTTAYVMVTMMSRWRPGGSDNAMAT